MRLILWKTIKEGRRKESTYKDLECTVVEVSCTAAATPVSSSPSALQKFPAGDGKRQLPLERPNSLWGEAKKDGFAPDPVTSGNGSGWGNGEDDDLAGVSAGSRLLGDRVTVPGVEAAEASENRRSPRLSRHLRLRWRVRRGWVVDGARSRLAKGLRLVMVRWGEEGDEEADFEVLDFQKGMVKMEREGHGMGSVEGGVGFRVWFETLTLDRALGIDVWRLETTCLSLSLFLSLFLSLAVSSIVYLLLDFFNFDFSSVWFCIVFGWLFVLFCSVYS